MEVARPPGAICGERNRRDNSMDRVYIMGHMFDQLNVYLSVRVCVWLYMCVYVCVFEAFILTLSLSSL